MVGKFNGICFWMKAYDMKKILYVFILYDDMRTKDVMLCMRMRCLCAKVHVKRYAACKAQAHSICYLRQRCARAKKKYGIRAARSAR